METLHLQGFRRGCVRWRPYGSAVLVRDFTDGLDVDQVLLVRAGRGARQARRRRVPEGLLRGPHGLGAGDGLGGRRGGPRGLPLRAGRCASSGASTQHPRYGGQLSLRALRPAEAGTFDLADLCPTARRGRPRPWRRDLRELVATVQDPWLRPPARAPARARRRRPGPRYRDAPAAKHYHQAYRHGLLEHCLSVAQGVSAVAAPSGASTATSRSRARCCTTSASSTRTPTTRRPST